MTVGELIGQLLSKSGVDATDAKYKDLVTINTAIPDGVDFTSNLFTRSEAERLLDNDAAFNSRQKIKHLAGIDGGIKDFLAGLGLEGEAADSITNEPSTYKRLPLLQAKVKELLEAKQDATGADKKALTTKIAELNAQIVTATEGKASEIKALTDRYEGEFTKNQIKQILSSFEYPDNTGISREDYLLLAENKLNQTLTAKKAAIVRNEQGLSLKQLDNQELDYFENNKPVTFADMAKNALTEAKLLKVNSGGAKPAANNGGQQGNNPADSRQQKLSDTQAILQKALGDKNTAQFAEVVTTT